MAHVTTISANQNQPLRNKQAIYRLLEYLASHRDSLNALLRQARADEEIEDIREVEELSDSVLSGSADDTERLSTKLEALVSELINCIGDVMCEVKGAYVGADFDNALSWHAARLHDLARDIRRT